MVATVPVALIGDKSCTATFSSGPVITLVNPNSGTQGQTGLNVAITGQSTHFAAGTSAVSFGAGITVGTVMVTDATHLTAQISIDAAAALGGRTVTVTTGAEVVSLANGFTVGGNPAVSLNPFGNQTISSAPGPYLVQVVNPQLPSQVMAAPADITLRINRAADTCQFSFSTTSTVVIPQGQSSTSVPNAFAAGRDQGCPGVPVTTTWTVLSAVIAPNAVPLVISQGTLSVTR